MAEPVLVEHEDLNSIPIAAVRFRKAIVSRSETTMKSQMAMEVLQYQRFPCMFKTIPNLIHTDSGTEQPPC